MNSREAIQCQKAFEAAWDEDLGRLITVLYDMDRPTLEKLVEAVQMIDAEGQDVLEPREDA